MTVNFRTCQDFVKTWANVLVNLIAINLTENTFKLIVDQEG